MPAPQSARWCYTLNNYAESDVDSVKLIACKYHVYGREVGESGTPHLQGFLVMFTKQSMAAMKKLIPRAHWEITKGTSEQARDYCKKDNVWWEHGELVTRSMAGKREADRHEAALVAAKAGRFEEIPADLYTKYCQNYHFIARQHMVPPPDSDDVTGVWLYGPAGVGKSRKAREDYPGAYMKMQNKWWDGYQDQEYVILDDFDSKELGHHLKIWADRYSFLAEIKGGAKMIRPKKFVITSNYSIDDFDWDDEMKNAIKRRFVVTHMIGMIGGVSLM